MARSAPAAAVLLVVLAVVGATCGPASQVDRAAPIDISVRVVGPDGAPVAGAPIRLARETSVGDFFGGFFLASFTLFTACLADPPPEPCRRALVRAATAAGDGGAAFQLTGKDTQTAVGRASTFSIASKQPAAAGELDGAATTLRFRVQTEALALPDLRTWDAGLRLDGVAHARWAALPPGGYGAGAGYRVLFEDTAGASVWTFEADHADLSFDPRVLEDTSGGAVVVGRRRLSARGTDVDALYGSARIAYTGSAGSPLSRGKPCTLDPPPASRPSGAAERSGVGATCPLTDGDLAAALGGVGSPAPPTSATVDLGSVRPVALVVGRGCACTLETSNDGTGWMRLGELPTGDASLRPPRAAQARYVRARSGSDAPAGLGSLRELSIWDGEPRQPGLDVSRLPSSAAGEGVAAPARTSSRTGWVVAAGVVLGIVVGAFAATALASRRR